MLARWNSEGNFESIFKNNTVSSEAKGIFKDIDDLDLNSKTIAWDKWADSMVKTDKNLKAFLTTEDKAYQTKDLATYTQYLKDQNKTLDIATVKTKALAFAKNMAVNAGIAFASFLVSKGIQALVDWANRAEIAREKSTELTKAWSDENTSISSSISKYKELKESLDSGTLSTQEIANAKNELAEIQDTLTSKYGQEALGIDLVNGKYDEQIKKLDELSRKKAEDYTAENYANIQEDIKYVNNSVKVDEELGSGAVFNPDTYNKYLKKYLDEYDALTTRVTDRNGIVGSSGLNIVGEGTREEIYNQLTSLFNDLSRDFGEDNPEVNKLKTALSGVISDSFDTEKMEQAKSNIKQYAEAQILSQNKTRQLYEDAINAVDNYNKALASGQGVEEAKANLDEVKQKVADNTSGISGAGQVFEDVWGGISEGAKTTSENVNKMTVFSKIIEDVEEKSSGLSKAYKEMSENGRLSLSTVKDLIEKYPELKDKIVSTSNGYVIEKSAIQESIDSMIQKYQLELEEAEKAALITPKACDINVEGYNQVTDSIYEAVQAKLIWLSTPDNVIGMNFDEWSKEYKKYSDLSNSINEIIERRKALAGLKSTVSNDVFNKTAKKSEVLKKHFDLLNHELEKFKDNLSILDKKLDMTFEGDYVDKLQTLSLQLETTAEYSASLRDEMDSLFSMTPSNAEEAEAIASQLESLGDSFFDNQRKLIEYKKQMTEARVELIESMAEISSDSLEGLSSAVDHTLNALENGSLTGSVIKDPSYYSVTLSAVEKQRKENEELIAEEKRYREKIADIREKAIKMSLDEAEATSAKIAKIVDETENNVNEGMQGIVNDVQKAADDISKIEFKAPRLDNVSWGKTSDDIKKFSEKAQSVWDKSLTDKPSALSGGNDAVDYARTQLGKKYVWGGQSPDKWFE